MKIPLTETISEDEPSWSLGEFNLPTPDSRALHRYQIIVVRRDGQPSKGQRDLGLATNFKKGEFRVQSFWYETVGQAQEIADYLRSQTDDWRDRILPTDIVDDYLVEQEMRKLKAVGLSSFGYGGKVQR